MLSTPVLLYTSNNSLVKYCLLVSEPTLVGFIYASANLTIGLSLIPVYFWGTSPNTFILSSSILLSNGVPLRIWFIAYFNGFSSYTCFWFGSIKSAVCLTTPGMNDAGKLETVSQNLSSKSSSP